MSPAPASQEHDHEPVRGLPETLPPGEALLWQGAPCWKTLARRGFHGGAITVYFAVLLTWDAARLLAGGGPAGETGMAILQLAGLAAVAVGLIGLFAWMVGRTTVYSITSKRVVLRFGIAFPLTLNVPFGSVEDAGLRLFGNGHGDIPLALSADTGMGYIVLWPHVRPWRLARARPMLRAVPDAERVAQILARALAAASAQPAPPAIRPLVDHAVSGASVPHATAVA